MLCNIQLVDAFEKSKIYYTKMSDTDASSLVVIEGNSLSISISHEAYPLHMNL